MAIIQPGNGIVSAAITGGGETPKKYLEKNRGNCVRMFSRRTFAQAYLQAYPVNRHRVKKT